MLSVSQDQDQAASLIACVYNVTEYYVPLLKNSDADAFFHLSSHSPKAYLVGSQGATSSSRSRSSGYKVFMIANPSPQHCNKGIRLMG
jgi:hypothetical protein